ncbi:MAG: oligosaccharide flippase family protein, partial [Candidatus Hadarchaeales archaeon]
MEELEHTNYARYLVKGTTIVFSELVVAGLIGLLLRMYLARGLSVEEYGLFYAALAFVSFFATFRDLGLSSALVKYIPEFEVRKRFGEIKSSIAFTLLFQAVFALPISVALFVFSDQIALVIFKTIQASLVIKILGIWFFTAIFLPLFQAVFQGFQNMLAYASMDFFNILFAFLSAMLLVGLLGLGVGGAALGYLLASLVVGVLGFILFRRRYSHVVAEKIQIKKPLIKRLFVFGLPAFIGGLGGLILSYQDTIMITLFRTLPEVGFYQVAQPTTRILGMFVGALTAVLFPMVSELWTRRKRRLLGRALHFLIKFSFILIVPVAL